MSERKQQLLAAIEAMTRVRDEWLDDDGKAVDETLEAVADVIELFRLGDMPGSLRDLERHVASLERLYRSYMERFEEGVTDPPESAFWKAVDTVQSAAKSTRKMPRKPLEKFAELDAQKVPDRQIALIYGFLDDDGQPNMQMVVEERRDPGRHTGQGSGWLDPRERADAALATQHDAANDRVQDRISARLAKVAAEAPESWESLFTQGISARQMALMKRCEVADVMAKADELGLPHPPLDYADPRTSRAPHEPPIHAAAAKALDAGAGNRVIKPEKSKSKPKPKAKPGSKANGKPKPAAQPSSPDLVDTEIARLAAEGHDADGIMEELAADASVTPERVERVLGELATA